MIVYNFTKPGQYCMLLLLILASSCSPTGDFRFDGAHDAEDARNIGGGITWLLVESNAPDAKLFSHSGMLVGSCPIRCEIVFDPTSAVAYGPGYGMIELGSSGAGYPVHFSGNVSAPGHQSRSFRVLVNRAKAGTKQTQTVHIELTPTFRKG